MNLSAHDLWWILPILIWDIAWKSIALWRSARAQETVWFVLLLVLNTVGILPIVYLLSHQAAGKNRT